MEMCQIGSYLSIKLALIHLAYNRTHDKSLRHDNSADAVNYSSKSNSSQIKLNYSA